MEAVLAVATLSAALLQFVDILRRAGGDGDGLRDALLGIPRRFLKKFHVREMVYGVVRSLTLSIRGGSDDEVYKKYPETQNHVPRGFTVFVIGDEYYTIRGFRKFFHATVGDDDGRASAVTCSPRTLCVKDGQRILFAEKSNGKCVLIRMVHTSDGGLWLLGGSKNYHRAVCMTGDDPLSDLPDDELWANILKTFWALVTSDTISLDVCLRMCETHTMLFEYEDGLHFIRHDGPPKLVLTGLISVEGVTMSLLLVDEFAKGSGIPTVSWDMFAGAGVDFGDFVTLLRAKEGTEGFVLNIQCHQAGAGAGAAGAGAGAAGAGAGAAGADGSWVTTRQVKLKTWWYMFFRSVRELLKKDKVSDLVTHLRPRYDGVHGTTSQIPHPLFSDYMGEALAFQEWLGRGRSQEEVTHALFHMGDGFANTFARFKKDE